jgi:ActR/RegA family two-component response regulator
MPSSPTRAAGTTRLLIVDDSELALELLADQIRRELGWEVVATPQVAGLEAVLDDGEPFDIAVVDLAFFGQAETGLDALLAIYEHTPACRLVVYTQGDSSVAEMLRDAWDAFELATALSKNRPIAAVLQDLRRVAEHGSAPVDVLLQPWLPPERSQWRSIDGYGRLVGHAGHAKLWRALIELDEEPSYKQLAEHTGLSLPSVRNYRSELLDHLALHYLDRPKMRQMQLFAKRCRPLLERHIRVKLGEAPGGGPTPGPGPGAAR